MLDKESVSTRVYLDHAAATPLSPVARTAMLPYLTDQYGNPSAIHAEGRAARQAVETARLQVARTLGVRQDQIIFTGSGTESNNLAVLGYLEALQVSGRSYETMEVLLTEIEHPSLLSLVPRLTERGIRVRYIPVTETGLITKVALRESLSPETVLVACAYINSEIGTVQPVLSLARIIREYAHAHAIEIQLHLDGAQAPLWVSCYEPQLGVDTLTLDAGKCGGPKGVGILMVREPRRLSSVMGGGGQERGLRPGTENVAGIVGAAAALADAQQYFKERSAQVLAVRDEALTQLQALLPEAVLNGPIGEQRVANNINFSLPGIDTEYVVVWLDTHGVAASTKSACAGAGGGMSHVVFACTGDEQRARHTLRFTLGETNTVEQLQSAFRLIVAVRDRVRGLTK